MCEISLSLSLSLAIRSSCPSQARGREHVWHVYVNFCCAVFESHVCWQLNLTFVLLMQSSPSKHANQDFSMDSVDDFLLEKAFKSNVVVGFHGEISCFFWLGQNLLKKKTTTHIPDLFFHGFPRQVDDLRSQLTTDFNWLAYETAINCHLFHT